MIAESTILAALLISYRNRTSFTGVCGLRPFTNEFGDRVAPRIGGCLDVGLVSTFSSNKRDCIAMLQ